MTAAVTHLNADARAFVERIATLDTPFDRLPTNTPSEEDFLAAWNAVPGPRLIADLSNFYSLVLLARKMVSGNIERKGAANARIAP